MPWYAQIDDNQIAVALTESERTIYGPDVILLSGHDDSVLGKQWTGSEWIAVDGLPSVTRLTRLEFRNRFTPSEKVAIYTAAESSVLVRIWLDDLAVAGYIDIADPSTIASVNGLVDAGLLTEQRAAEILA